jgi:hypothetical protein
LAVWFLETVSTNRSPKSAIDVLAAFNKVRNEMAPIAHTNDGPKLKARCRRMALRNLLVGNTVFSFDKDGISVTVDTGRVREDYEQLLMMNGVDAVSDAASSSEGSAPAVENAPVVEENDSPTVTVEEPPATSVEQPVPTEVTTDETVTEVVDVESAEIGDPAEKLKKRKGPKKTA